MRARDLDFFGMLRPEPEKGCLYLHQRRVLVVNADALGTLRRDLIGALGADRARGFLTRYGWSCGFHDAQDLKERFPWDAEEEWLLAAPRLHQQEGVAHVRVIRSRVDKAAGTFDVEGIWAHSYEAEQHLHHCGPHPTPVCWTLAGYAGGYGTAYMGRRVIYRELECVGRGDPVCRFLGRTLADWGPEVATDLPYYEETKIGEELERAYAQIQDQHRVLAQSAAIHRELTRLVLEGNGPAEITASLARLLARPVVVENRSRQVLAAAGAAGAQPAAAGAGPVARATESSAGRALVADLEVGRRTVTLPGEWLAAPIAAGSRLLGTVACGLAGAPPGDLEVAVLERAASVYALALLQERTAAQVEERILGDVLQALLTGDFPDGPLLARRAQRLGLDLARPHRVLVASLGAIGDEEVRQRLAAAAREAPGVQAAAVRGDHLVAIARCPEGGDPVAGATAVAGGLQERLGTALGAGGAPGAPAAAAPPVAAGPPCAGAREYAAGYTRAREALAILAGLGRGGQVLAYEELGPYASLFRDGAELAAWAARRLAPLVEQDRRRGGGLVDTLAAYLQHSGNLRAAATALNLHLSGLKYRLGRIEELLGADLGQLQVQFELHLALLVTRLAGARPG